VPVRPSDDGRAAESTPGGLIASAKTAMNAFTAPWSGFRSSIAARQMTPVAKSEIAIGMKTTTLKAVVHRTRSVRTAKISPSAVASAGTTATQIALFLIAVSVVSLVNSSW
jgi:hypothetical protein